MKRLPKRWHEAGGTVHHLIAQTFDGDIEIVVSKRWLSRKQRWHYSGRPRDEVDLWRELHRRNLSESE